MPSHSVIQCQSNKHVSLTHKLYCGCVSHTGVPSELVNSLGVQIEFHPYVCILGNQTKAWNGGCSGIPDGKIRLCHRVTLGLSHNSLGHSRPLLGRVMEPTTTPSVHL